MTKTPKQPPKPAPAPPAGRVLSSSPTDPANLKSGFDLTVQLNTTALGQHTLVVHSNVADMGLAVEDVRKRLAAMGYELAKAFDQPNSLK